MSGASASGAPRSGAPLRAVLLDVDGTLVDSNQAHAQSWADILPEFGARRSAEEVRPLVGMGGDHVIQTLLGIDAGSEEGKRVSARRRDHFLERYAPTLRAFDGTVALLDRLRADGYTLVIATAAQRDELEAILAAAGLDDLVEERTSSSDADRSKPAPDVVEAAIERAGVAAHECVMLGDTPYDIEAATRAGVPLIAFRSGGWGDDRLVGALAVYDGTRDLLDRYDDSPLGAGRRGLDLPMGKGGPR